MFRLKTIAIFSVIAASQLMWTDSADAGPLLDWLRGRRCCRTPQVCRTPVAPSCGTCQTTCRQTCSRVVVNYVPYTAYRTNWERVPVTTYRQSSSTDPCTGCTVTCNRPCTTYSWRMKQVPFTTYRPVYRTETYQVPVTYTTPAPAPTCNTCALPAQPQYQPQYSPTPAGTLDPNAYYQQQPAANGGVTYEPATPTTVPADLQPTLGANPQSSNRPVIQGGTSSYWPTRIQTQPAAGVQYTPIKDPNPSARWNDSQAPQLMNPFNQSAQAPSVERWDYSPVRLASYETPFPTPAALQPQARSNEYVGSIQSRTRQSRSQSNPSKPRVNEGWRND